MNTVDLLPLNIWLELKGWIFHWLTTPRLVILPLLLVTAVSWAISSRRRRSRNRVGKLLFQSVAFVLLVYLLIGSPLGAFLAVRGLTFPLPEDPGTQVDAIVVLDRGDKLKKPRVELATQLFQDDRAPRIWTIGGDDVRAIRKQLKARNLSAENLAGVDCARTTYEEAILSAAVLGPQGVRQIMLITDPPHMLRALLTFKSFGWEVIPRVSPLPSDFTSIEVSWLSIQNYLGLASYWLLGRFRQRSPDELQHPSSEILRRLDSNSCGLKRLSGKT